MGNIILMFLMTLFIVMMALCVMAIGGFIGHTIAVLVFGEMWSEVGITTGVILFAISMAITAIESI